MNINFNLQQFWRRRGAGNFALLPLSGLFAAAAMLRRKLYSAGVLHSAAAKVPVVVVGNIVAGGGGKTPLTIAIVQELQKRGWNPGVATRGTGGEYSGAFRVQKDSSWRRCGDEPLLIFRRTGAPVVAAKKRIVAARALADSGCDIVVCDDGLQHYALRRDMEICAVNAEFGFGNGWLLPAGPLRENARRMMTCDWIVACGDGDFSHPKAAYSPIRREEFYALGDMQTPKTAADFAGKRVVAIAGIASPKRFFDSLRAAGIAVSAEYPLADHGRMEDGRLAALDADIILMTEKDAVKYSPADSRLHCLRISAELPPQLVESVCGLRRK